MDAKDGSELAAGRNAVAWAEDRQLYSARSWSRNWNRAERDFRVGDVQAALSLPKSNCSRYWLMQRANCVFFASGADWAEKRPANILRFETKAEKTAWRSNVWPRRARIWCRCGKRRAGIDSRTQESRNCCQFLDSVPYPGAGIGAASDSGSSVFCLPEWQSGRAA